MGKPEPGMQAGVPQSVGRTHPSLGLWVLPTGLAGYRAWSQGPYHTRQEVGSNAAMNAVAEAGSGPWLYVSHPCSRGRSCGGQEV